jgi:hypothetical protein
MGSLLMAVVVVPLVLALAPLGTAGALRSEQSAAAAADQPGSVGTVTSGANGFILSPAEGPAGVLITVTGSTAATSPVTLTFTDASGTVTPLTVTAALSGTFAISLTLPITLPPGLGFVNISTATNAGSALYFVQAPTVTLSTAHGTRCTATTLALDNFAPDIPITPTLVYTTAAGTVTARPLAAVTPSATGLVSPALSFNLPGDAAYNSTGVISLTASYPLTPAGGFPTFALGPAPTMAVIPSAVDAPGVTYTLTLSSTGSGAFNLPPGATMVFSMSLLGQPPTPLLPTTLVTNSATGTFTATVQVLPPVPGTYVITATDTGGCNDALPQAAFAPTATPVPPTATASPSATAPPTSTPLPPSPTTAAVQAHTTAPRTALTIRASAPRRVVSGKDLAVRVQAWSGASLHLDLEVVAQRLEMVGKGAHRKRVRQAVLLYRAAVHATADVHGRYTGRLRIAYKPAHAVLARLTVTAWVGRRPLKATTQVSIQPQTPRTIRATKRARHG